MIKRAYKMRAYPTVQQQSRAAQLLADHCDLYNAALQERRGAWRQCGVTVRYGDQSAQLRDIRAVCPEQARWSFTAQQQTLRRLDRTYRAFFARIKAGKKAGPPRFRSHSRFDTVDHVNGDGAKWFPSGGRWAKARFQGVGTIKVSEHTRVQGRVTQVSLRRENGGRRWYVIVIAEQDTVPLPETGSEVGVDVGIARFLTTSDGEVVGNPRWARQAAIELAGLQRQLALRKRGSGNYRRTRRKIARLHRRIANQRRDFHHQTARRLVNDHDQIAVEKLNVAGMSRTARGTEEEPGRNVAAKAGLNRSIMDAGWGQFVGILEAKVRQHEPTRALIPVNPHNTSRDCHHCGQRCARPRQDTVVCPVHGPLDADWNGAINIATRAGLGSGEPPPGG